jgi:hexokinase
MSKIKVIQFLKKYSMDFESIDIEKNCGIFMDEMEAGLCGNGSSLEMIPTYISMDKDIPAEEPVIVVDAGGTNLRAALVCFDKNKQPDIKDFRLYPMPGTKGEITVGEFFVTVSQYIKPILHKSNKIGFCFSYPAEILPSRDGRIISFCKEVQVKDAKGKLLGENMLKAMKSAGYSNDKSIVVLNDAVATLLGGRAAYPDRKFDSYIGFILGTGTNTCYIERSKNIKKMPETSNFGRSMLVNMESSGYAKAPRGKIDIEFDNSTINPGQHIFEKMVSGGYQGGLMLAVLSKAVQEGVFGRFFADRLVGIKELSTKEIDEFLYYPYGSNTLASCCENDDDRVTLYYLVDSVIERAARLIAINLSAVILKLGKGSNPCAPVCITAEGTTFYKSKMLRGKLDYYIRTYLNEKKGAYCEFVKVDNATMAGTAIAALMNAPDG